jgi:hypothetical protein
VVPAKAGGLLDIIREIFGSFRAKCRDCSARFEIGSGGVVSIFYARCPRCMRQDLGAWDERHYHRTWWMALRIGLGAHRWRCDVCRANFVSFRPRRQKYVPPAQRLPEEQH